MADRRKQPPIPNWERNADQRTARAAFDKLSPEQKRNVLNWGNPEGLNPNAGLHATLEGQMNAARTGRPRALTPNEVETLRGGGLAAKALRINLQNEKSQLLNTQVSALQTASKANQASVNEAFAGLYPKGVKIRESVGNRLYTPGEHTVMGNPAFGEPAEVAKYPAAYMNPNATDALAEQMSRLEEVYPGITHRMASVEVGRHSSAAAWYNDAVPKHLRQELGLSSMDASLTHAPPGAVPYNMGTPARAQLIAHPEHLTDPNFEHFVGKSHSALSDPSWVAANDALYPNYLHSVGAHELGHAVHYSMHDFVKSIDTRLQRGEPVTQAEIEAAMHYRNFVTRLGNSNAHISGYANWAAEHEGFHPWGVIPQGQASKEPFAELFSVARSPQGVDIYKKGTGGAAFRDIVGASEASGPRWRTGAQQMKLADNVGEFNSVEKGLRKVGFNEVGSAAPVMALQVAAPILAGLLAAKTHGATRSALEGAAGGAALGSWGGPEGTLAGGAIGAGLGLAKQLL